jgi:hypothetical protein
VVYLVVSSPHVEDGSLGGRKIESRQGKYRVVVFEMKKVIYILERREREVKMKCECVKQHIK